MVAIASSLLDSLRTVSSPAFRLVFRLNDVCNGEMNAFKKPFKGLHHDDGRVIIS